MAASVHGRPTIYCNDQCLWGVMQDTAQLIETIDTYEGLLANPDYGRVQVRVTDEMVARGALGLDGKA